MYRINAMHRWAHASCAGCCMACQATGETRLQLQAAQATLHCAGQSGMRSWCTASTQCTGRQLQLLLTQHMTPVLHVMT